jgi:hypothetical protein
LTDKADGLSGYLPEVLLSGCRFEFGGAAVAQGAVQPGAVAADVFDDGAARGAVPGRLGPPLVVQLAAGRVGCARRGAPERGAPPGRSPRAAKPRV